jgi:hypothetical protein
MREPGGPAGATAGASDREIPRSSARIASVSAPIAVGPVLRTAERVDLVAVAAPRGGIREARVVGELRPADRGQDAIDDLLRAAGDRDPAIVRGPVRISG